ncbi:hypothetical protein BGP_2259 [Beggiatoa sp. PS]|nr:hypothetical protein BGP_2259 [Beggiatoa sp. PS]
MLLFVSLLFWLIFRFYPDDFFWGEFWFLTLDDCGKIGFNSEYFLKKRCFL